MLLHQALLSPVRTRLRRPRVAAPVAAVRVLARVRGFKLDERLLDGEDPSGSAVLSTRAAYLTSSPTRERLAEALRGLLRQAELPARAARISPDAAALLANEPQILVLADRLERRGPVYARGVARTSRLATDSTGPVFRGPASLLGASIEAALRELDGAAPGVTRASPRGGQLSQRRLARITRRRAGGRGPATSDAGNSFALPDGSWFHGRRDGA